MLYYKVSQPPAKSAGPSYSNTTNSLSTNGVEISVGHCTDQPLVGQILGAIEINGFLKIVNDHALQTVYGVRGCETNTAWETKRVTGDANQQVAGQQICGMIRVGRGPW